MNQQVVKIPQKIANVLATNKRFKVVYGGRGGGRSWAFSLYCLVRGQRTALKVLCCRETQTSIRESSHALLKQWIEKVPTFGAFYTVESNRIIGKNGTEIIFRGLQEVGVHNIKSLEGVDIVFLDEAASISNRSWDMLIPTIRKPGSEFLIAFNPQSENDPVWQQIIINRAPMTASAHVNVWDNPFAPQTLLDEAEQMRSVDANRFAHIWEGKPLDQSDNQLIPTSLVIEAQTRKTVKVDGPIVLAIDPARFGDDETAFVVRQDYDILHWETHNGLDTIAIEEKAVNLAVKYAVAAIVIDVGGGYGGGPYDQLRKKGLSCRVVAYSGAYASRRIGYKNLRADSYNAMKDWLRHGRIPADRKWTEQLISVHYFYDTAGKMVIESKEDLKARGGKSPDVIDGLVMSLCHGLAERKQDKSTQRPAPSVGNWMGV